MFIALSVTSYESHCRCPYSLSPNTTFQEIQLSWYHPQEHLTQPFKQIITQPSESQKQKCSGTTRTQYKMKINLRQIFISSHKKYILCITILTCQVFTARSVTSYQSHYRCPCSLSPNTPFQEVQLSWYHHQEHVMQ